MKKIKLLLIVIFLLSAGSSMQFLAAQEKTKAELEQEQKIQQAIDLQKKVMAEQKKAEAEAEASLESQKIVKDDLVKDLQINVESTGKAGDAVRIYGPRGNRSYQFDEPFNFSTGGDGFYGRGMNGDSERSAWDFSKSVKEKSFSKEYSFDVEKTAKTVVMSVMGDCKAGEIRIKIMMPSNKSYSDILIDESGNLNWRKSFNISETDNQDKTGEWKFKIESNKATGYFKISLQTF